MPMTTLTGAVDLDRADIKHARQLQQEYFDGVTCLAPEQALRAAKLAIALADAGVAGLPEEALDQLLVMLDPAIEGEPLSFHVYRWAHREWLRIGQRPSPDPRAWLPHTGRFALDGVVMRVEDRLSDEQFAVLQDDLKTAKGERFWAMNFATLESRLDRMENAREIYNRLLGLVVELHACGELLAEYRGLVDSFVRLGEKRPDALVYKLGLLTVQLPEVITCGGARGLRLELTRLFDRGLGETVDSEGLVRALQRHPVLRAALARALRQGGLGLLSPLRERERVAVLATGPEVLGAGMTGPGVGNAAWLSDAAVIAPLIDKIGAAEGGAIARIRAYLWIRGAGSLDGIDRALQDAVRSELREIAPEVLEKGVQRSALAWIERHPRLLCDRAWGGSNRLRAAAWLAPERVRALLVAHPSAFRDLVEITIEQPRSFVPLARRLLGALTDASGFCAAAFEGDSALLLFTSLCLVDATDVAAITRAHAVMKAEGELEYASGIPRVPFVSGRVLKRLADKRDREDSRASEAVCLDLFVRSAAFGTHERTALQYAESMGPGTAYCDAEQMRDGVDPNLLLALFARNPEEPPSSGELLLAILAAMPEEEVERVVPRMLGLGTTNVPESAREAIIVRSWEIWSAARRVTAVRLAPIPLSTLTASDAGELTTALIDIVREDWAHAEELAPLILAGANCLQHAKLGKALADAGLGNQLAPTAGVLSHQELKATALTLGADRGTAEKIADRCGDEVLPAAARCALVELTSGGIAWGDGQTGPAALLLAVMDGPWARQPSSVARALLAVLTERTETSGRPARWIRGVIYALGKLREPLGGKTPTVLHAVAHNPRVPEEIRAVALEQEPLFDKENMAIQRKFTDGQRVQQAVRSLALAGVRVGEMGAVHVVRR